MTRLDNDLISRKALLKAMQEMIATKGFTVCHEGGDTDYVLTSDDVTDLLTNAPTIEADSGEVVAWESIAGTKTSYGDGMVRATFSIGKDEVLTVITHESVKNVALNFIQPRAKREWVELTDEQISLMAFNDDTGDWNDLRFRDCWREGYLLGAKATQAKLKEFNHG